ncbi:MAG: nitrite reductase [Spirosomataceae bacterium]
MRSFDTEIDNPLVERDILDLAEKIRAFREGTLHEDKFRSLRLARGVYGQRQAGVQMVRIKLPYGKMTFAQWQRIADISDEYSNGNLHLTTRQDIQIHFVSLDRTPELWAKLERDQITLREACGNTVRNVTASERAGIDPEEPFDVIPMAHTIFQYFLRNPICQEMGRKIKISVSNSEKDSALSFMHDIGLVPKLDEQGRRGYRVMIGGGLGAQPRLADQAFEFLPEEEVVPFIEALLRVFDRQGERISRAKARLKFLLNKVGFDTVMQWIEEEKTALPSLQVPVSTIDTSCDLPTQFWDGPEPETEEYQTWRNTNVFYQKQEGYAGVYIRVLLGNISSNLSRQILSELKGYVGDDIRVTIHQGLFLRFVPLQNLPYVYQVLEKAGLSEPGANSTAHITACPGTDTCNLAIADSTHSTQVLEKVITEEFRDFIYDQDIKIKISGCMNSCGQHGMAHIGFHGSSLKAPDKRVLPALQVLLGGGPLGDGQGRMAEKIIKVPTKRGPQVLRSLLGDYEENRLEGEYFHAYYDRQGKNYFYELLKPLASLESIVEDDFIDWGHEETFSTAIGVGECAGVLVDLVATLLLESVEKLDWYQEAVKQEAWSDAIYHAYSAQVNAAKALLLDRDIQCSTQGKVIQSFDESYPEFGGDWAVKILTINQNPPSQTFALTYGQQAHEFVSLARQIREKQFSS